jgi:hypothetical protein
MTVEKKRIFGVIAKCLGALWILDGLLQFQPQMFGQNFVTQVLVPNLSDQPSFLHAIVNAGINAWNLNPVVSDSAAAILQICIGLLLFFPISDKRFRFGAYVSIFWGIVVWLCGEGAGLLLTGNASFYTGAPGAVLFYVLLAALLLAAENVSTRRLPQIAGWTLLVGAALQLQSVFWTLDGVQGTAMASMMESIHIFRVFPTYVSNVLGVNPTVGNTLLIIIPLVVGLFLIFKPDRLVGAIALLFLFLTWWIGQDFGMLTSGIGTDPSTAPLIALFILPLFLQAQRRTQNEL